MTMHVVYDEEQIKEELEAEFGTRCPTRLTWSPKKFTDAWQASGRTQVELADLTGVKQPTISDLATGSAERPTTTKKNLKKGNASGTEGSGLPLRKDIIMLYALAQAMGCHLRDFANIPPTCRRTITTTQIRRLQPRLLEVDQIVTLINPRTTSLRDIYYRTLLLDESISRQSSTRRAPFQIDALSDLKQFACVILGTAGQGKSILLRFLTIQEALKEETLVHRGFMSAGDCSVIRRVRIVSGGGL